MVVQGGGTYSRSARFDLDSVYSGGPVTHSELYDPQHPTKLLVESGGQFEDVPRRADHSAIIGDPATTAISSSPGCVPRS